MTPNPKNIGAAPEGFALEVGKTYITRDGSSKVKIAYRRAGDAFPMKGVVVEGFVISPIYRENGLYTSDMTFGYKHDLVAEVSPQEGEALPEPSPAKGPSLPEVTQPGEGVDLEAAGLWLSHDNQDKLTVAYGKALIAEVRSLRATLRRESK